MGTSNTAGGRGARGRRGIAMVLVLVSVGVAVVMAGAVLTRQENTPAIGDNAVAHARSGWAAESGAEYARAALETGIDWSATGGSLMEGFSIGGAEVDVVLTDMEGNTPSGDESELLMTATATVNGISKTVQKVVQVQPSVAPVEAVDPELKEFGVFAAGRLEIEDGFTIKPWPASPTAPTSPVKVGAGYETLSDSNYSPSLRLPHATLYVGAHASSTLKDSVDDGQFADGRVLSLRVPVIPKAPPSVFFSLPWTNIEDSYASDATITGGGRMDDSLVVENGAVVTLDGSGAGDYATDDLTLTMNGVLRIEGDVRLLVLDDLVITGGATIELADDATLELYLGDTAVLVGGGLGVDRAIARETEPDPSALTTYRAPTDIQIFELPESYGGGSGGEIRVEGGSAVFGCIHAPGKVLTLRDASFIVGRLTASRFVARGDSAMLYDPGLDMRCGFTQMNGPLYQANGDPIDGLQEALDTFNWVMGHEALDDWIGSNVPGATQGVTPATQTTQVDGGTAEANVRYAWLLEVLEFPMEAFEIEYVASGGDPDDYDQMAMINSILYGVDQTVDDTVSTGQGVQDVLGLGGGGSLFGGDD